MGEYVTPVRKVSYQAAQRYKLSVEQDFSTFASSKSKHHRRYFIFGDYEVGKTSLWLRYIFYDQKHAQISGIKETPLHDGYIFTKKLFDGHTDYEIEFWDFLTPLEARQCLEKNTKIDPKHAKYDPIQKN